jgi:hypothetical protein
MRIIKKKNVISNRNYIFYYSHLNVDNKYSYFEVSLVVVGIAKVKKYALV